jgi:hypothetical protein
MINLPTKSWFDVVKVTFLVIVLGVSTGYVMANWSAPSFTAPDCPASEPACNPPINVSTTDQVKPGGIGATKLTADFGGFSQAVFIGFIGDSSVNIPKSNGTLYYYNDAFKPTPGAVLTAADTSGKVVWGAGGGLSGVYIKRAGMNRSSSSDVQVERCNNNSGDHDCTLVDCKANDDSSLGRCVYKTFAGKSVNDVELLCNQTNGQYDVAISGSATNLKTKGKLFAVDPISDATGVPIGYRCIDVSKTGGECVVACAKR